ncbi:uncharacterized protein EDB91DRAFT_1178294, partial [Suillus paluster]|uniref:uncharacterized protein n=1 Tax=Suillus paluster TaxID=48578 RepID=UPI001B87A86B
MSQQDEDLLDIDWLKLRDTILASCAVTEINNWSINHPYIAAGALLCISGNPELLLTPLRLTGKTARYICLLPFRLFFWPFKMLGRLILYIFGFRRGGVAKDSFASRYQSRRYGGYVPRDSGFAKFQSHGATEYDEDEGGSTLAVAVSWLSGAGAVFVLGQGMGVVVL